MKTVYLAHADYISDLEAELKRQNPQKIEIYDRLMIVDDERELKSVWAQNIWFDAHQTPIASIGEAAKILKELGRNWAYYSPKFLRRSELIKEKLGHYPEKLLNFLQPMAEAPMGAYGLLDEHTMIYSPRTSSPLPLGTARFNENHHTPPSRAYLKLWESLTVDQLIPARGSNCIDFGSCPGGWTWVLQQAGAKVLSIDKAPLDPKVSALENITFWQTSAFSLRPKDVVKKWSNNEGKVDWFFSDIICYPNKLLEYIHEWRDSGLCQNFVCTIKFQGATDFDIVEKFLEIPNSKARHLYNNKHEITWWVQGEKK
jgi:23S rRNA (cytidine2498-2'-O)-methyltransferase